MLDAKDQSVKVQQGQFERFLFKSGVYWSQIYSSIRKRAKRKENHLLETTLALKIPSIVFFYMKCTQNLKLNGFQGKYNFYNLQIYQVNALNREMYALVPKTIKLHRIYLTVKYAT